MLVVCAFQPWEERITASTGRGRGQKWRGSKVDGEECVLKCYDCTQYMVRVP